MIIVVKKHPLRPYLAFYMQFSQCALFLKARPTNYRIHHNFNCYINERETSKTCLTNHKGSISHHIMPLVINSLGGGHKHTHKHTRILTSRIKAISRNKSHAGQRPAHTWFKKIKLSPCDRLLLSLHSSGKIDINNFKGCNTAS